MHREREQSSLRRCIVTTYKTGKDGNDSWVK